MKKSDILLWIGIGTSIITMLMMFAFVEENDNLFVAAGLSLMFTQGVLSFKYIECKEENDMYHQWSSWDYIKKFTISWSKQFFSGLLLAAFMLIFFAASEGFIAQSIFFALTLVVYFLPSLVIYKKERKKLEKSK